MSPRKRAFAIAGVSLGIMLGAFSVVPVRAMETARIAEISMPEPKAVITLFKKVLTQLNAISDGSVSGVFGEYVRDARHTFDRWRVEAVPKPTEDLPADSPFIAEASSMFDTIANWVASIDRFLADLFSLESGKNLLSAIAGLFATVWGAIVFGATWFWDHILGVMVKSTIDSIFFWK